MLDSLPSRPLRRADIERLRARETVDEFVELESRVHVLYNGGLQEAVALTGRTVVSLSFKGGAWERTVLARNADRQRLLKEALEKID